MAVEGLATLDHLDDFDKRQVSPKEVCMSEKYLNPGDLISSLATAITSITHRAIYFQISIGHRGKVEIKQIEFLSVEEFARLAKVETRTVHGWIERGVAPTPYRPEGCRSILFDVNEVIAWIKNNPLSGVNNARH